MFNFKIIIAGVIVAALMIGGVIDLKVYPAELPKVPGRLLSLVQGDDLLAQGQDYVTGLLSSFKREKSDAKEAEDSEDKDGEVAGAKDEKEDKSTSAKEETKKESPTLTIPLRF